MTRARAVALGMAAGMLAVAVACTESQAPLGNGDDVISDIDASEQQPPQEDASEDYDAAVFAPVESGYPAAPDGYAPYDWCTQCGCPSGTFCFGGGTGYTSFDGDCHADGGPLADAGLSIGCFPIPPACEDADAACACLIETVSPYVTGCYPDCTAKGNIVSCPNP